MPFKPWPLLLTRRDQHRKPPAADHSSSTHLQCAAAACADRIKPTHGLNEMASVHGRMHAFPRPSSAMHGSGQAARSGRREAQTDRWQACRGWRHSLWQRIPRQRGAGKRNAGHGTLRRRPTRAARNSAATQDRPACRSHTAVSAAVNRHGVLPTSHRRALHCCASPPSAQWMAARQTGKQKTALRRFHVVPGTGIEPVRSCPRRILSPLRLPVSPPGQTRIGCLKRPQHGILPSAQIARE